MLPGSATVPALLPAAHSGELPMRWWGSGPAALADAPEVTAAATVGAASSDDGTAPPAAASRDLEGWLGYSPAAAAAGSAAATAAAAVGGLPHTAYPPVTCDERVVAVPHPAQQQWLAPAIPEDRPLAGLTCPAEPAGHHFGRAGAAGSHMDAALRSGSPHASTSPTAATAAATPPAAMVPAAGRTVLGDAVSGRQQLAGQQHLRLGSTTGGTTAGAVQQPGQMTWEQMMQQASGGGATSAATPGNTSNTVRAALHQQQQPMADDSASVADIAASPFAHLLAAGAATGAAAAGASSPPPSSGGRMHHNGVMGRDASGPLSLTPPPPGALQQHGHPLALPGVRQTNAAAAPAGVTATAAAAAEMPHAAPAAAVRDAAPTAAAAAAAGSSRAGTGWLDWGSALPASASPFAAGRPAFDDGSLSAAVAATAASLVAEGPADSSGHCNPFAAATYSDAASTASGSGSGSKPGARRVRYSTDTAGSSSIATTGHSWSSSTSSNKAPAARAQLPHPAAPSPIAAAASPFADPAAAPHSPVRPAGPVPGGGGGGQRALAVQASVGVKPTRYLSGPTAALDPHWDFGQAGVKPVRVLLQVNLEEEQTPVTLILMCSAPPPPPAVLAQIVLPSDPPNAGVDLAIDANRDLAFPSNSFLGAGAFGQVHRAVYRARHPVAVKMLTDPGLRAPDRDTLKSFREELSIMAKLDHPNILRCYGGNLQGCPSPFIVTELCECSLDKMIHYYRRQQGTGLPLRHTLTVGLHVASALWHLHPSIVHRDLKPQNVLLDINGTAKVADFGLSRIKTHTYLSTQYVAAGAASYMAPECFAGGHVGEKADVYSLACLLLECVTGERPWQGLNVVQVAFQVAMVKAKPALPAEDPSTCPHELLTLLGDCLSFNPRERPSSGEVMKLCAHMMRTYLPGAY